MSDGQRRTNVDEERDAARRNGAGNANEDPIKISDDEARIKSSSEEAAIGAAANGAPIGTRITTRYGSSGRDGGTHDGIIRY